MDGIRYIVLGKYMLLSVRGRSVRGGGGRFVRWEGGQVRGEAAQRSREKLTCV